MMRRKTFSKIVAYTPEMQKLLGLKAEPRPYLHCLILAFTESQMLDNNKWQHTKYAQAIVYVWDTRKILDYTDISDSDVLDVKQALKDAKSVKDNKEPLKGNAGAAANFYVFGDYQK